MTELARLGSNCKLQMTSLQIGRPTTTNSRLNESKEMVMCPRELLDTSTRVQLTDGRKL
jgi:hypothetical protein